MIGIVIFALLVFTAAIIIFGLSREWPKHEQTPLVTVVVCARDEEERIFDCLMSLATQSYPADRYRLIVVNHLSRDRTGEILEEFTRNAPIPTRLIHINEPDEELKGKVHALAVALDHVETELALITDGDCIVQENWIRTLVSYFDENIVGVGGLVTVGLDDASGNWVSRMQHVDHRYYLGILAAFSGLRAPSPGKRPLRNLLPKPLRNILSPFRPSFCIGNNLAIRMSTYREIGGYRAIGPSLIEDYALVNAMVGKSRKQLAVVLDPEARVFTTPEESLRGLWRQKRRWATGLNVFSPLSTILFSLIFVMRIVIPWMVLFDPLAALANLVLVVIGDIAIIRLVSHKTGDSICIRDIIIHEIYQIVLNHALLFASLTRWPVIWKGDRY